MKYIYLLILSLHCSVLWAGEIKVSGTIYLDQNQNGKQDTCEPGIKNVLVSDGFRIAKTNGRGNFKLKTKVGRQIFPILPAGYSFSGDLWWHDLEEDGDQKIEFGLLDTPIKKKFRGLVIGDIQVNDTQELSYADRSILSELRSRDDYDFSIFLGDLVNDEPSLLPPLKTMLEGLSQPSYVVYGNHDRNADLAHDMQQRDFNTSFGPESYAFYKNNVLFVVLNSLIPTGTYGYSEVYPEKDLAFLENMLAHTKKEQFLVISQHVPLGMIDNKESLLDLLQNQQQVLLLAGHTHTVYQHLREREGLAPIHELTAGAVSGHWWTGEKDWQGVPLALMRDGTPRGYFELTFNEEEGQISYRIRYKGVGLDRNHQMSIWLGEPSTEINHTLSSQTPVFYVNFYGASPHSRLEFRLGDSPWIEMQRTRMPDPHVERIRLLQREDLMPNAVSRKSPYRKQNSSHIFKGEIPFELPEGPAFLEIRAFDPYGDPIIDGRWIGIGD